MRMTEALQDRLHKRGQGLDGTNHEQQLDSGDRRHPLVTKELHEGVGHSGKDAEQRDRRGHRHVHKPTELVGELSAVRLEA